MTNEEKPNLTLVSSRETPGMSDVERTLNMERIIQEYECGIDADTKPEWCIFGNDGNGEATVLYWIRPSPESELVAWKIAKYLKSLGTLAGVEMTEWNPNMKDTPIYAQTASDVSKRIEWNTESK